MLCARVVVNASHSHVWPVDIVCRLHTSLHPSAQTACSATSHYWLRTCRDLQNSTSPTRHTASRSLCQSPLPLSPFSVVHLHSLQALLETHWANTAKKVAKQLASTSPDGVHENVEAFVELCKKAKPVELL